MGQWVAPKQYARWSPPKLGLEDLLKANRKRGRNPDKAAKAKDPRLVEEAGGQMAFDIKPQKYTGKSGNMRRSARDPGGPNDPNAARSSSKTGQIPGQGVLWGDEAAVPPGTSAASAGGASSGSHVAPSRGYSDGPAARSIQGRVAGKNVASTMPDMRPKSYDYEGVADQPAITSGGRDRFKALTRTAEPFGQMSLFDVPRDRETATFSTAFPDKQERASNTPAGMPPSRQVAAWAVRPSVNKKPGSQGTLIRPRKYR